MAFNDYIDFLVAAGDLPDSAQLAARRVVCDGRNPNLVLSRRPADSRVLGCYPQTAALAPQLGEGGALTPGATYVWGVQRVIQQDGVDLVPSLVVASDPLECAREQTDYRLTCGAADPDAVADLWARVSAGYFRITVNGASRNIGPVDLTNSVTFPAIAAKLQTAVQAEGNDFAAVTVTYDAVAGAFVFAAPTAILALETWYDSDNGTKWDLAANANHPANGAWTITGANAQYADFTDTPVTDGEFAIVLDGQTYNVTGLDFSGYTSPRGDHTYGEIAAVVQAGIRALGGEFSDVTCEAFLDGAYYKFRIELGFGWHECSYLQQVSGGTGTDISGNTGGGGIGNYLGMKDATQATQSQADGDEQYALLCGTAGDGAVASSPSETDPAGTILVTPYEYPPEAGASWSVVYRIWRSRSGAATVLYLVDELSQAELEALGPEWVTATAYKVGQVVRSGGAWYRCKVAHTSAAATLPESGADWATKWTLGAGPLYYDITADDDLETAATVDLAEPLENLVPPPARFVRAWNGRFVLAGAAEYRRGTLTVEAGDLDLAVVDSPGEMSLFDVGARIRIDGEDKTFTVLEVNVDGNGDPESYDLDQACTAARDEVDYCLFRENDLVTVTEPLAGNIEGYTVGNAVYSNAGSGNRVTGIAVQGGLCLILREGRIDSLEGASLAYQLTPLPGSPPGCASAATIADEYSPAVYYYSGRSVVRVTGGTATEISGPVNRLIRDDVLHDYDAWTHAVYDPDTALYHLWLYQAGDVVLDEAGEPTWRVPSLLLSYDTRRNQWYVGELSASASGLWRDAAGRLYPVIGIAGGVARLESGTSDGADVAGTVTAGGAATLTDSSATFATTGAGLAGIPVHLTHADGTVERRIVVSNTATQLTVHADWDDAPEAGDTYHVGAIRWHAETGRIELATALEQTKRIDRVVVVHEPDTEQNLLTLTVRGILTAEGAEASAVCDLDESEMSELSASRLGLRSRGCVVRLAGDGTRSATILCLAVEATEVSKR